MKFIYRKIFLIVIFLNALLFFYNFTVCPIFSQQHKILKPTEKVPTIFCMILTSVKSLKKLKPKTVYETWGKKCDNYKFISIMPAEILTQYHNSSNQYGIELDYGFNLLQPPGLINDTYGKLTDKVFLTYKYLYNKYNNYDWYLKADDDSFIFMDNLRSFLADKNPSQPVTYGYDFKLIVEKGYHSGGGGYLLSNQALLRLGYNLNRNFTYCKNTGTEDVDVARCLRKLGVFPNKSIDSYGRERFHPLSIFHHYYGEFPEWLEQYASNPIQKVNLFSHIFSNK